MNELALFAGAGGGILGGKLLGWRTVCAVEWERYPACVLAARQNDGLLPPFPIWDDVQTFDGKPWRGIVDVVSGGFPCQDISAANSKGKGLDGERSGMWREMARIIGEVQPRYAFVENSPMLTSRGLDTVLGNLSEMGYDAEWGVISAADVGANHLRERIWIVAKQRNFFSYPEHDRSRWREQQSESFKEKNGSMANSRRELRETGNSAYLDSSKEKRSTSPIYFEPSSTGYGEKQWWKTEPNVGRVAYGVAAGMDRLKAIGNGQVPLCAATAWKLLNERLANRQYG